MQLEQMETQVAEGNMPPEALARTEQMMSGPFGIGSALISGILGSLLVGLLATLLVLLAVNFMLGARLSFRQAWSLQWWAGLIYLVPLVLNIALSYATQQFPIHMGLGILAPAEDATSGFGTFIGMFLDSINPFAAWYLAVGAIGASVMTGKPMKPVFIVFVGVYLVASLFGSGLGSMLQNMGR
jgi:hypothetical protein